jgi:HSP20 family protein
MSDADPNREEDTMALPVLSRPRSVVERDPLGQLDAVFDRLSSLWESEVRGVADRWLPSADVEETDDAWQVEVELPGVRDEDVDVELDDRVLTVSGEVQEKERAGILRRRTRRVGAFHYAVTLPGDVDADHVDAQLRDGVLTVRVPKSPGTERRHIRIGG